MGSRQTTVDTKEIHQFSSLAQQWWAPHGPMRALHQLGPVRLAYIRQIAQEHFTRISPLGKPLDAFKPFEGLRVLDVGCGGGLLTEPLVRLGAQVVGLDASAQALAVARLHAEEKGLDITYVNKPIEAFQGTFDMVCVMEVLEHVADVALFIHHCRRCLHPGGLFLFSTLNRTLRAWLCAIVGAEMILRLVPKGTHQWDKFITPHELANLCAQSGLHMRPPTGLVYRPWATNPWRLCLKQTAVNYIGYATVSGVESDGE